MPGYKIHDRVALVAAPIIIVASSRILPLQDALLLGVAFLIANRYLSPDLDIDSIMNHRWGILRFIWWPYKKLFHHRSFWTHSGPISATIRFVYLAVFLAPLFYLIPLYYIAGFYIAMILCDILHTTLDKVL